MTITNDDLHPPNPQQCHLRIRQRPEGFHDNGEDTSHDDYITSLESSIVRRQLALERIVHILESSRLEMDIRSALEIAKNALSSINPSDLGEASHVTQR